MTTENTPIPALAASAENVSSIVSNTPDNYTRNQLSVSRCHAAGEKLLAQIKEGDMTDDLDRAIADFIEKSRRTLKAMNERRAPLTKLFDQVRREFTGLENQIDPSKPGTIPYRLQQARNQFAARRREQEEARLRAEESKRQAEAAREKYRLDILENYKAQFNNLVNADLNRLTDLNASVNLDNYSAVLDTVTGFDSTLPSDWQPVTTLRRPVGMTPEESQTLCAEIFQSLRPQFVEQYSTEINDYRQEILDRLPSKRAELERAAKANAQEAKRIKEQLAQREAAEAARKEAERLIREKEAAAKAEAMKANSEAVNLFNLAQTAAPVYQPKTKVTKKINITGPAGYMQVLAMWWSKEGSYLSKEELDKIFRKQISFCEKLANKEGEFISDPTVQYTEEVKAQ